MLRRGAIERRACHREEIQGKQAIEKNTIEGEHTTQGYRNMYAQSDIATIAIIKLKHPCT